MPTDDWVGHAETHSAVVFFVGDRAYKLKKPVDLGFLDFRTLDARREVCHREIELNRRLAPDVYLGVADVTGPDGAVCDHLVVMRRMPTDRRLSTLLDAGQPVDRHLWRLAHLLATLHARSPRTAAADLAAGVDATRGRWEANTADLLHRVRDAAQRDVVMSMQALASRYLDGRAPLFDRRVAEGRAVDGHGDLLADDIFCLDDGPRALDCIEFDDRLRLGDGLSDAAFLAMDLERLGHPDLATGFLDAYREHADDTWPASLARHHIAYRAQVRAKVAAIRAEQGEPDALAQLGLHLEIALRHLREARVRLVVVGGLPGTGKSTLAAALADTLRATVLRSDEVRKELAGLRPTDPAPASYGEGIYTAASTDATYDELLRRAGIALALGETVVLDASFAAGRWREAARSVASATASDIVELRCDAPADVASARLRRRVAVARDPSDATPEIAAAMAADVAPWPEATTVDTRDTPDSALRVALEAARG